MKRTFLLIIAFVTISVFSAKADEGMWPAHLINQQNIKDMQALGCKLTPEQIFSFNQSSVKDAIVQFGGGCTAEVVSPEGLLFTNHHCGYSHIQSHSTPEHDYLTDGFWAYSKEEELPNPGLTAWFLVSIEDITEEILKGVKDKMTEKQREEKISENIKKYIEKAYEKDETHDIEVEEFYHGNQYMKFEYIIYEDVRLVGTPPSSIGKFGGDTDNWEWPRQTGDFSIFRIYTAPDGSPAPYAEENIPLKPKHYLPVSIKGVNEGDFSMILGYPGSTDRYAVSENIKNLVNEIEPAIVTCRGMKLEQYNAHMEADNELYIKYANKQAGIANYWKYSIGQMRQIKQNKVIEKRQELEKEFDAWVKADKDRTKIYGNVLSDYKTIYDTLNRYSKALIYHGEAGLRGSEAISLAYAFSVAAERVDDPEQQEKLQEMLPRLQKRADNFFKDYDANLDKDVSIAMLNLFYKDIPEEMRPEMINEIGKRDHGDFTKFITDAFKASIFVSQEKVNKWIENPTSLKDDPLLKIGISIQNSRKKLGENVESSYTLLSQTNRLFMNGLMSMQPSRNFYPDANFTMRFTYGSVKPYYPKDAVFYNYESTLKGVMEKEVPGDLEFNVSPKLKELYEKKDYGQYANKNGDMIVNFLTTNDITGGNSGSPVINAEGHLIGLAFDGNWEAMSGDIAFEKELQRTICVDARYVLFIIDKYANAQNLIKELNIIK
ncbi:MAG: S46 family peptidase [Bacteroidales bacterium]|jgi:hypothetical protein|nr:S46 family peptidase [Bacteroidales bacterium]